MRKWRVVLLLVLVLFIPARVQASPLVTFSSMEIDLWPEYDQPAMLVIYRITLDKATILPADVILHIPAAVGDPSAVATRQTNGQLLDLAYNRSIAGDWSAVSFKTASYQIQFEYYDPALDKNGATRTFKYTWPADYAVTTLNMQVQQPVGASQMVLSPNLGSPLASGSGLAYYDALIGSVPAGHIFKLSIQYQKNSDTLSQSVQPIQPSETLGPNTNGRTNSPSILIWILGILALLLMGGCVFIILLGGNLVWPFHSKRLEVTFEENKRHKPAKNAAGDDKAVPEQGVFCHQCGKRAAPGDVFCRVCGARLRKE